MNSGPFVRARRRIHCNSDSYPWVHRRPEVDKGVHVARPEESAGKRASFAPVVFLMFLAILINFVDRGNLSIAAPLLKDEWHISASRFGLLFSAFFWTYTAMQFVSGWLVDRLDAGILLAIGFLIWSLATAATGLVPGFALLLVMRMLLGIGESIIFPSCSKILAKGLPEHARGFANGVLIAAIRCGAIAGTFGGGFLMTKYGWRPAFIWIGLVSLLWLPAWLRWMPREGGRKQASAPSVPAFAAILRTRSFWGTSAGTFCSNYLLYFMVTWLPLYLVREFHLSMAGMVRIAGIYYVTDASAAFATGWLTDLWIRNGGTPTLVRKSAMALGFAIAAVAIGGCAGANAHTYLGFLLAAGIGNGISGSGVWAFCQTLAGAEAAGRWTGLQNGLGNFAGVIGPALTGYLVERTGNFRAALLVASALAVAGGFAWVYGVGRLEKINWKQSIPPALAPLNEVV